VLARLGMTEVRLFVEQQGEPEALHRLIGDGFPARLLAGLLQKVFREDGAERRGRSGHARHPFHGRSKIA
jgi:hypothetical protein